MIVTALINVMCTLFNNYPGCSRHVQIIAVKYDYINKEIEFVSV